jgi:hypothetical protein
MHFPSIQETIIKHKSINNSFEKQYDSLLHYDCIPKNDPDRQTVNEILKNMKKIAQNSKQDKAIACFIGSAIGDTLGN